MQRGYINARPKQTHHLEVNFVNPNFNGDSSRSSETIISLETNATHGISRAGTYTTDASGEQSESSGTEQNGTADEDTELTGPVKRMEMPGTATTNADASTTSSGTPQKVLHSVNGQMRILPQPYQHFFHEETQAEADQTSNRPQPTTDEEYEGHEDMSLMKAHFKEFYDYQKFADIPIRHAADMSHHFEFQFPGELSTVSEFSMIGDEHTNLAATVSAAVGVKISPIRSLEQPKLKAAEKKPKFDKNTVPTPAIKTFAEAHFGICSEHDWQYIKHPNKMLAHECILNMVREGNNPDVKVYIGKSAKFKCHSIVLKAYSELCKELADMTEVHFSEKCITPSGFVSVYEWMINDRAYFEFNEIIEFYEAATYLRIPMLVKQIWEYLDDCQRFSEEPACFTYLAARERNVELVAEIMLRRINNFFMMFVSTLEFLTVPVQDLCRLLSSSLLGVNTEIELFMVAVYWLNHNWPIRKDYAVEVMRTIRFSLMPTLYIVNLHTKTKLCPEVERCIDNKETAEMIYGGFMVGHIDRSKLQSIEEFAFEINNKPVTRSDDRKWMYDRQCEYHHASNCINKHLLTYDIFLRHLRKLNAGGGAYYTAMQLVSADTPGLRCCDGPKLK